MHEIISPKKFVKSTLFCKIDTFTKFLSRICKSKPIMEFSLNKCCIWIDSWLDKGILTSENFFFHHKWEHATLICKLDIYVHSLQMAAIFLQLFSLSSLSFCYHHHYGLGVQNLSRYDIAKNAKRHKMLLPFFYSFYFAFTCHYVQEVRYQLPLANNWWHFLCVSLCVEMKLLFSNTLAHNVEFLMQKIFVKTSYSVIL